MKHFKSENPYHIDQERFIEKLMSLTDKDIEQLKLIAQKYGLSQQQINEGMQFVSRLRRQSN